METLKIGILREEKVPQDRRTPITPAQASKIMELYPFIKIYCQTSDTRCFSDAEYEKEGVKVLYDMSHCDILLGIKEVKPESLMEGKTYMFFSHTIKEQPYNRGLLQTIVKKNIRLIDYECLVDKKGMRVIAFGRWAGIVGAYNAFWTYGRKYEIIYLKRAYSCRNVNELFTWAKKISLPQIKILVVGNGRVARGALETLRAIGIKRIDPEQYLFQQCNQAVYTQIDADVYYKRKDGKSFSFKHFFKHPDRYESAFKPFTHCTDIMIMAAYWDPASPKLFELEDVKQKGFKIRVIADITCDINGSVPTTIRATTIEEPVYDFDLQNLRELPPFSAQEHLSVMAVDNLPNELPRDASVSFGEQMIEHVLPELVKGFNRPLIKWATITENGDLTERYEYLRDYLMGNE